MRKCSRARHSSRISAGKGPGQQAQHSFRQQLSLRSNHSLPLSTPLQPILCPISSMRTPQQGRMSCRGQRGRVAGAGRGHKRVSVQGEGVQACRTRDTVHCAIAPRRARRATRWQVAHEQDRDKNCKQTCPAGTRAGVVCGTALHLLVADGHQEAVDALVGAFNQQLRKHNRPLQPGEGPRGATDPNPVKSAGSSHTQLSSQHPHLPDARQRLRATAQAPTPAASRCKEPGAALT